MCWRAAFSAAETACASMFSSSTPKRAIISAQRFDKPLADLFDMQDEIVARLANALNAELALPRPDAPHGPDPELDGPLFQGLAWFNKGPTPDSLAQARGFFDRALAIDPDNVDARRIGASGCGRGQFVFSVRSDGGLRCCRSEVDQSLVVRPGPRARPCVVRICRDIDKHAAEGIAECERAPELDRNLRGALALSDLVRFLSAAPKKPRLTLPRPCASVRAIRGPTLGCSPRAWRRTTSADTKKPSRGVGDNRGQPKLSGA